jgi:hypothetical protein
LYAKSPAENDKGASLRIRARSRLLAAGVCTGARHVTQLRESLVNTSSVPLRPAEPHRCAAARVPAVA